MIHQYKNYFFKRKDYGNSPHAAFKNCVKFTVQKLFEHLCLEQGIKKVENRCVLFQETLNQALERKLEENWILQSRAELQIIPQALCQQ